MRCSRAVTASSTRLSWQCVGRHAASTGNPYELPAERSVAWAFGSRLGLGHPFRHLSLYSVEVEARSTLHRWKIEEGLEFFAYDLLDEHKTPKLEFEPRTGCGFLKAGEIGCKPLQSWVFCWRAEFGVNPIAGRSEWPKVGTGNAISS